MKKITIASLILVFLNIAICHAQEGERKFTFQTSPLLFLTNLISLGVGDETIALFVMDLESQYKINDIFSVSFTLSFLTSNQTISSYERYERNMFEINLKPMFVYRPLRTGLKGFYVGLYPTIGWHSEKSEYDKYGYEDSSYTLIGLGVNTGYKWVFNNGFTVQLGSGIGKSWFFPKGPDIILMTSDCRLILKNFDLYVIDFKLGYSF
jgi:hypothetical protein